MTTPLVIPKARFFDSNGLPLAGGKLYSYGAGTAVLKATFTDAGGLVPNANPVILSASGEATIWLAGAYKLTLTDANDVVQWTIDNVKELLTTPSGAFTLVSSAPTVLDATTFTLPGDQTTYFFTNQRVKFTTSSTTVYARVNSAVFGAGITTVIISNGSINVGIPSGVYVGLGDVGLPIDARHVAYGTTGETVDDALGDRLSKSGGGEVVSAVVFDDGIEVTGDSVFHDNVTFEKPVALNQISSGILALTAVATNIPVPASALDYRRLRLSIVGCECNAFFTPYIQVNGDSGPNYEFHTLTVGDVGVGEFHAAGNDSINPINTGIPAAPHAPTPNPVNLDIEFTDLNNADDVLSIKYESGFIADTVPGYYHTRGVARYTGVGPLTSIQILLENSYGSAATGGTIIPAAFGTWALTGEM